MDNKLMEFLVVICKFYNLQIFQILKCNCVVAMQTLRERKRERYAKGVLYYNNYITVD